MGDFYPIKTEEDYENALAEIERIFDASPGTPKGDRLDVLVTLVEAYEDQHYSIPEGVLFTPYDNSPASQSRPTARSW